jgi:hypothetical protein
MQNPKILKNFDRRMKTDDGLWLQTNAAAFP